MNERPLLQDLRDRLNEQAAIVSAYKWNHNPTSDAHLRLEAKQAGIIHAISFVDEYLRGVWDHVAEFSTLAPAGVDPGEHPAAHQGAGVAVEAEPSHGTTPATPAESTMPNEGET